MIEEATNQIINNLMRTTHQQPFELVEVIGRGVFRSCMEFLLEHSLLAMPIQVFTIRPIENIQEGATWVALPLVEIVIVEIS